jgi:DNA-directed RNA polymerase sigma subunit (sigma70/sigma32)
MRSSVSQSTTNRVTPQTVSPCDDALCAKDEASPVSLDQSVLPDGSTLETMVADPAASDPELEAVEHEQARLVDAAVAGLPEPQRAILTRHLGLGRTQEEIAEIAAELHLSQQRTRAIERDALSALRDRLAIGYGKPAPDRGDLRKALPRTPG